MREHKRRIASTLLDRMAHADVFEIGPEPRFLFILFGGSGVDEVEYEARGETLIPLFGRLLDGLERSGLGFVMVHVTAPYDVPFNRFAAEPAAADTWNAHVRTELLTPWADLPYFVSGFSGGAALALNGLHRERRCFGGGVLGADAIPPDFACPGHWAGSLRIYIAPDDRVCNAPDNRRIIAALERRGQAEVLPLRSGRHRLADYATTEGLGDLLRAADTLAPDRPWS